MTGFGGDEGVRTPDLLTASQTRSQLRHTPITWNISYYNISFFEMQENFKIYCIIFGEW